MSIPKQSFPFHGPKPGDELWIELPPDGGYGGRAIRRDAATGNLSDISDHTAHDGVTPTVDGHFTVKGFQANEQGRHYGDGTVSHAASWKAKVKASPETNTQELSGTVTDVELNI